MAFPTVAATNTNSTPQTTTHTISLPSGITAGDLLIIIFSMGYVGATVTAPSGWSTLVSLDDGTGGGNSTAFLAVFYKVATGSEGATVTASSSLARPSVHSSYRISGYQGAPEAATATGMNGSPNPPSLSPSWGSAETLWIAAMAAAISGGASAFPANYTNGLTAGQTNVAAPVSGASARRENEVASEDPGAFTVSGTPRWVAATVAVQPASATSAVAEPTGVGATGGAGTPTVTGGAATALTGQQATGSAGTATAMGGALVALAGHGATGAVGTISATSDAEALLAGVSATGHAGSPTVTGGAVVNLSGISATGAVGSVLIQADDTVAVPAGVAALGTVGTLTVTTGAVVALTGVAGSAGAGALSAGEVSGALQGRFDKARYEAPPVLIARREQPPVIVAQYEAPQVLIARQEQHPTMKARRQPRAFTARRAA